MRGFTSFPEPIAEDKVRGKPAKFADHYTQATLFYRSQTPVEQQHIQHALRFELTKVQVPAIRQRVVAMLRNVDEALALTVATDLGLELPEALPLALDAPVQPEIEMSQALSLLARPGDGTIAGRRVAILVASGCDVQAASAVHAHLSSLGAVPRYVGATLGAIAGEDGESLDVEVTLETMPSVLFDALMIPGGHAGAQALANVGLAVESIVNAYRHCKPILALGAGRSLLENSGVPARLPSGEPDPGLLTFEDEEADAALEPFVEAIARHRHYQRELDPAAV
jgi:catalase